MSRTPYRNVPLIGGEEVDLYKLYWLVTAHGGWEKVSGLCHISRFRLDNSNRILNLHLTIKIATAMQHTNTKRILPRQRSSAVSGCPTVAPRPCAIEGGERRDR